MRNFLTDDERNILKAQHKRERDKRVCDRIKAVLLYDKGWTLMQIAELFYYQMMLFANTFKNTENPENLNLKMVAQ